jgi:hypothetical protein
MLTIIIAIARKVGRSVDESVIKIGAIYATHMLVILNLKRMLVYAYNKSGLCLAYSEDIIRG